MRLFVFVACVAASTPHSAQARYYDPRVQELFDGLDLARDAESTVALSIELGERLDELRPQLLAEGLETPEGDARRWSFVEASRRLAAILLELRPEDREEPIRVLDGALAVAEARGHPNHIAIVTDDLANELVFAGDHKRARKIVDAELERARSWIYSPPLYLQSVRAARRGADWKGALSRLDEAFSEGVLLDVPGARAPDGGPVAPEIVDIHARMRGLLVGERMRVEQELGLFEQAARSVAELEDLAGREGAHDDVIFESRLVRAAYSFFLDDFGSVENAFAGVDTDSLPRGQRARALWYLGMAAGLARRRGAGDPTRAIELLVESLALDSIDPTSEIEAYNLLARLAIGAGAFEDAREHVAAARRAWPQTPELLVGGSWLGTLGAEARLHRLWPSSTLDDQRAALAGLERGLEALLESWQNAPDRSGGIGFLESDLRKTLVGELVQLLPVVHGSAEGLERGLERLLQVQGMGSLSRDEHTGSLTLERLRRDLIPAGGGLINFLTTDDRALALVVGQDSMALLDLGSPWALRSDVHEFVKVLRQRPSPEGAEAHLSRVLSLGENVAARVLTDAVRQEIGLWSSLSVSGLDQLDSLPIEALPWKDGRLVGETFAVDALPSMTAGLLIASRAPEAWSFDHDAILIGNLQPSPAASKLDPSVTPLPESDATLAELVAPYGSDRVTTLLGSGATLRALREADLENFPVVQFTAHGVFDPSRERGAGLALAPGDGEMDGGVLWADDAEHLECRGLVVLTACGAALGPRRTGGDEVGSLGGAFLQAGALAVIGTKARIELGTARSLSESLHEGLLRGQTPAEALREARSSGDASHRLDLAQVQLLGYGHRPLFEPRSPSLAARLAPASLAVLLVLALVVTWRRRRVTKSHPDQLLGGVQ